MSYLSGCESEVKAYRARVAIQTSRWSTCLRQPSSRGPTDPGQYGMRFSCAALCVPAKEGVAVPTSVLIDLLVFGDDHRTGKRSHPGNLG